MKNKIYNSNVLKAVFMVAALPMLLVGTLIAQSSTEFTTWHFENPEEEIADTRTTGFWYPERAFFTVVDTNSYSGQNSIAVAYDPAALGGSQDDNFRMSFDNVHNLGIKPQQTVHARVFVPEESAGKITAIIVYDMWNRGERGGSGFHYVPTTYPMDGDDIKVGEWVTLTHLIDRDVTKETLSRIGLRINIDIAYTGDAPMILVDFVTTDPDAEPLERSTTNVEQIAEVPAGFSLEQNFPNPFNPTTNIEFSIPQSSSVTLEVFNMQGQSVATLVDGMLGAGTHRVNFNAANLPSGMYMYRIQAGSFTQVNKMMLVK
ncbi:MAG: T9SS type A sorting domain-containing protein [Bacteroidetes bacterium]|nr:T9SS type A sorting domain-containing protein [Bacteroidota bacterium]MCH8523902.1 T9SS type A sorting domain-containing protein [Balneolales bacterium]